jgi:hypothetical protein
MSKRLGFALIVASLVGCGGSSSHPDPQISCYWASNGECDLASGPQAALDVYDFTAASCTRNGGVVVSSCTATGRVGSCTLKQTTGTTTVTMVATYYAPLHTQADVTSFCSLNGGTFSPRLVGQDSTWSSNAAGWMSLEQP